jgi:hypothetical protein
MPPRGRFRVALVAESWQFLCASLAAVAVLSKAAIYDEEEGEKRAIRGHVCTLTCDSAGLLICLGRKRNAMTRVDADSW